MHKEKTTILIVDDHEVNRKILRHLLEDDYGVMEAENGRQALETIKANHKIISAVLLDLVMPIMDGYDFLIELKTTSYYGIPVIVTTDSDKRDSEKKAFNLGAWDYVLKPYDAQILKYRLQSAIAKSENVSLQKMRHMAEHDGLTGLHNRSKLFENTEEMLKTYPDESFAFVSFDMDRFSLINTFFGNSEGDKLLIYIAGQLKNFVKTFSIARYGRIEADQFAFCCNCADIAKLQELIMIFCGSLKQYPLNFEIALSFGIYQITDKTISARQMLDNANLAAKHAKGHYHNHIVLYTEEMGRQLIQEQEIVNEMNGALEAEQFSVYIQPKYDLNSNLPVGGEILVRWNHPIKGMISPSVFIPIFEKNGFIARLDYYVWEKACALLAELSACNIPQMPISVNVSRIHLYNPQLADILCQMVDKYQIPHALFNLELTESIYTENPAIIQDGISKLHKAGFIVMMDDFGSGYSSLNVLKDVEFDVLKIDMRFFQNSSNQGRGENIIASVIRMAKWLGVPTIAEGVEKQEQVAFLRNIGCEYVQGFYFAKPMPIDQYKALLADGEKENIKSEVSFSPNQFWNNNSQIELLFSTMPQPLALYEFCNEKIELVRVNHAFNTLFGYYDIATNSRTPERVLTSEYVSVMWNAFHTAIDTKDTGECDYLRLCFDGKERWIHINLKYVNQVGGKHILLGILWDITPQVKINQELLHYKALLGEPPKKKKRILIVDDIEVNRVVLAQMFQDKFDILLAENGQVAKEILQSHQYAVDIILLDLIMPVMDGKTFLEQKREHPFMRDIPVVIITTDTDPLKQIDILELGANDYIAKPFVKELALKRIDNVLESSSRYLDMLKQYHHVLELSKKDSLTGTYNRTSTENLVNQHLQARPDQTHGFLMLDIDNFKTINDTYGHLIGDEVLKEVTDKLQGFFRSSDIIGRIGGDEFIVFLPAVGSAEQLLLKSNQLCSMLNNSLYTNAKLNVSVCIGISLSQEDSTFMRLYEQSDQALYAAKHAGKMQAKLYKPE